MTDDEKAIERANSVAEWLRKYWLPSNADDIDAVIAIAKRAIAKPEPACVMCGGKPIETGTAGCKDCNHFAEDSLRPVESPDEYRILREDEQTVATDERMYSDGYRSWTAMTAMDGWESGMTVKELRAKFMSWHNVVVRRRKVVPPVESPDDWATQNIAPSRPGIDQCRFSDGDGNSTEWFQALPGFSRSHGDIIDWHRYEVRCRRKDLPPKQMPVRLWVSKDIGDGERYQVFAQTSPPENAWKYVEIRIDPDGKTSVSSAMPEKGTEAVMSFQDSMTKYNAQNLRQ